MAECEANYARLMKLMPQMHDEDHEDSRVFMVELPNNLAARFKLSIVERCKYTTILEFRQLDGGLAEQLDWAPAPHFLLRVYHDARMAEVSAFQGNHRLKSKYPYPNDAMFHRDEKVQLNQLLSEWLIHCLRYGHSLDPVNCQ